MPNMGSEVPEIIDPIYKGLDAQLWPKERRTIPRLMILTETTRRKKTTFSVGPLRSESVFRSSLPVLSTTLPVRLTASFAFSPICQPDLSHHLLAETLLPSVAQPLTQQVEAAWQHCVVSCVMTFTVSITSGCLLMFCATE